MGCRYINTPIDRKGRNPVTDFQLMLKYISMIRRIKPKVVLTYTVKPDIFGGIACKICHVPYLANITGLGDSLENGGLTAEIVKLLYRISLDKASCVFFQNHSNLDYFAENKLIKTRARLIPGTGVNLHENCPEEYPDDKTVRFLFIGRITRGKGINEYLDAARIMKERHPNTEFHIVGWIEDKKLADKLDRFTGDGYVVFHGKRDNIHQYIKNCHALVLPSYHEAISNVLLEAASTARPVIASRIPGCIETFDEGVSGLAFRPGDTADLVRALEDFLRLPYEKKREMGLAGRRKMERNFDRRIVIGAYLQEINKILNKERHYALRKIG